MRDGGGTTDIEVETSDW